MDEAVTLLIVEDEPIVVDVLHDALTDAGFVVVTATTGADAIAALDNADLALAGMITDIRLGGELSGWDVARHAREASPVFPVVYMTADSAAAWGALGVPNSVLVQKPFVMSQVVTAIATLLNDAGSNSAT
jgi:DNA-binding response OmpR family regulator